MYNKKWFIVRQSWSEAEFEVRVAAPLRRLVVDYRKRRGLVEKPNAESKDQGSSSSGGSSTRFRSAVSSQFDDDNDDETTEEDEVDDYFKLKRAKERTGVFSWLDSQHERFPTLYLIAADYLAIAPTSVPRQVAVERVFSAAGRVTSPLRKRLSEESIRELVCMMG